MDKGNKKKGILVIAAVIMIAVIAAVLFLIAPLQHASNEIAPGKYTGVQIIEEEDGSYTDITIEISVYENTQVENSLYVTIEEKVKTEHKDGFDVQIMTTFSNEAVLLKGETPGVLRFSLYPIRLPAAGMKPMYLEIKQDGSKKILFRYADSETALEQTEYIQLMRGERYADSPVELPLSVPYIPVEDVLVEGSSKGISVSHTDVSYPWLIFGLPLPDYEEAVLLGEERVIADTLPGAVEGVWKIVRISGVDYYYEEFEDHPASEVVYYVLAEKTAPQLACGLRVGLSEEECLQLMPELVKEEDISPYWEFNDALYPTGFAKEFAPVYTAQIFCGCGEGEEERTHVPVGLYVLMRDGKVEAITAIGPTAN
ncbi:MAG: hypothetical protein J1E65_03685 [Lachnospiraceae bacterium]|nr:hypothetical protein [Lachnospiraceae bacterium]